MDFVGEAPRDCWQHTRAWMHLSPCSSSFLLLVKTPIVIGWIGALVVQLVVLEWSIYLMKSDFFWSNNPICFFFKFCGSWCHLQLNTSLVGATSADWWNRWSPVGPVEFYVAIDTWVSNDTRSKVLYISNVSEPWCPKIGTFVLGDGKIGIWTFLQTYFFNFLKGLVRGLLVSL